MFVAAQKTGPRYVSPREMDDDGDLSADLFASSTAGCVFIERTGNMKQQNGKCYFVSKITARLYQDNITFLKMYTSR